MSRSLSLMGTVLHVQLGLWSMVWNLFYTLYIFCFNDLYSSGDSFKLFQDTRQQIAKLSGVHSLLKRLQFLFKLPGKLKVTLQEGNYAQVCIWNVERLWWILKTLQSIPNTNHNLSVTVYSCILSVIFLSLFILISMSPPPPAPSNFWTSWQIFWNVGVNILPLEVTQPLCTLLSHLPLL
jgi:hypothetical protein